MENYFKKIDKAISISTSFVFIVGFLFGLLNFIILHLDTFYSKKVGLIVLIFFGSFYLLNLPRRISWDRLTGWEWASLIFVFSVVVSSDLIRNLSVSSVTKNLIFSLSLIFFAPYLLRKNKDVVLMFLLIGTPLALITICIDIISPGTFSYVPGRAAGIFINPNIAGTIIGLSAFFILSQIPSQYLLGFLASMGLILFSTLSRSNLLAYVISCLIYISLQRKEHNFLTKESLKRVIKILSIGIILYIGLFFISPTFKFQLMDRTMDAAEVSPEMNLEDIPLDELESKYSGLARMLLLKKSAINLKENFHVGIGLAPSFYLSSHNSYLLFLLGYGSLGIFVFLVIIYFIFRAGKKRFDLRKLPVLSFLLLICLFSHDALLNLQIISAFLITFSSESILFIRKEANEGPFISAKGTILNN